MEERPLTPPEEIPKKSDEHKEFERLLSCYNKIESALIWGEPNPKRLGACRRIIKYLEKVIAILDEELAFELMMYNKNRRQ